MPAVITNKFRIHNAAQFVESLSEAENNSMYLYLGIVTDFANPFSPPSPGSTPANTDIDPWLTMFGAKRIQSGDISHVTKRYNWVSGIVYDQYDDKGANGTDVLTSSFYVVTDEFNVYKCLFNNGNVTSTVKPTGTDTTVITTSDGYKWKYMFTISTVDALKFFTPNHIPVKTLTTDDGSNQWLVQQAAVEGAIDIILVENGGSGYVSAPTVTAIGDGTGLQLTASVSGGSVTSVNILNRGSGYTKVDITFTGGGSGGGAPTGVASARAIIPPRGGHGFDPIYELGGVNVLMNVRLDGTESGTFSAANDFRQLGIIVDPNSYGTTTVATAPVYRQTYKYQLVDVSGSPGVFQSDEVVTFGSNTAVVVEYEVDAESGNNYLYTTLPTSQLFQVGNNLQSASANGTILTVETPGLKPYSGNIIYIENRVAVTRATDQVEDVKLVVEF